MATSLQVLLWMSLALGCLSHPATEQASTTSTLKTPTSSTAVPVSKNPVPSNGSEQITPLPETVPNESEETGISHIIKHSKLFTEFVSFAVNPVKSMELVDSVKSGILADTAAIQQSQTNETSSESVAGPVESNSFLQELFVEMTKVNSPGFVVSFDYLNVTAKSSDGEKMFRKPVRMWGILPDELNNKTVYFLADHYRAASVDVETKSSAKEQVEDFESWKKDTLSSDEFTDDKLGDGVIGSLLG